MSRPASPLVPFIQLLPAAALIRLLPPAALVLLLSAPALLLPVPQLAAQQLRYDREYPAVGYSTKTPIDRVAELQRAIARADAELTFDAKGGYLASLLESLHIPVESQMLVFSKTSFQVRFVSPETPRALYFSDDVYVAWLLGSEFLEIAAMDPNLGPVFYTLGQMRGDAPDFKRATGLCLQCHDTYGLAGGGVPRFLIGSGPTNEIGRSASHGTWRLTTDQTPLAERWGGWYVTGTHGAQTHMGNVVLSVPADAASGRAPSNGNLTDLTGLLDAGLYLTGHSDIVALMVAEHQIHVQNVMTRASWDARSADVTDPTSSDIVTLAEPLAETLAEPLVRAMLFVDEATLNGPIQGTSGFRSHFESLGPRDEQGRSLREMDLTRRLFRYPLSYLIHSDAFGVLPGALKEQVFRRIWEVASGQDTSDVFDHLSAADRGAILEILSATHADFARWLAANPSA